MTQHILSLSYGKDSLACLGAIEKLGWQLDRIVHAEIWATDTIPADLPPMVEFKAKADEIIKQRYGIEVEHIYAIRGGEQDTYEKRFYARLEKGKFVGSIKGFPMVIGGWCKHLKYGSEIDLRKHILSENQTQGGSRIYGFPMCRGNWCNSNLKMAAIRRSQALQADGASIAPGNSRNNLWVPCISRERKLVYPTQDQSFPIVPYHRGLTEIRWCNIWVLLWTNLNVWQDLMVSQRFHLWRLLAGQKPIVESGVRKTIFSPQSTQRQHGAVVGSVITRA